MSSIRSLAKSFYLKLAIIRELRSITQAVLEMRGDIRRIAAKELVELLHFQS
jgi:hypothetical protein